jgi:hypothetical protein
MISIPSPLDVFILSVMCFTVNVSVKMVKIINTFKLELIRGLGFSGPLCLYFAGMRP